MLSRQSGSLSGRMLEKSFFFILLVISFFSCKEKEQEKVVTVLYPNQDAPLILLMREMTLTWRE